MREDVLVAGVRKRFQRQEAIGTSKDYPTKRLAQRALDDRIAHVNKVSYRPMPAAKFAATRRQMVPSVLLRSWHPNQRRLLFATRNGTPWDQNLLLKREFRPLLRALGIQVPRGNGFHAFRHANATLMSSFGASQKLRQQRLGHADGPQSPRQSIRT